MERQLKAEEGGTEPGRWWGVGNLAYTVAGWEGGGRVVAFVCTAAGQGQAVARVTCLVSSTFPRMPNLAQLESGEGGRMKA